MKLCALYGRLCDANQKGVPMDSNTTRLEWISVLKKISGPVLAHAASGTLHQSMPVEGKNPQTKQSAHLEAVGRTLCGIAPFLESIGGTPLEQEERLALAQTARLALSRGVDPLEPDRLNFSQGYQAIVDAAFLAQGILRAPIELWDKLSVKAKQNVITAMKQTRTRKPARSNWLLFSAMIEAFLYFAGEPDWDPMRIDYAIKDHMDFYKGDGVYGDGHALHCDYYNSFVIQPMLWDILACVGPCHPDWESLILPVQKRAKRFGAVLLRMIAPDGSYPLVGRSLTYRFGAFHLPAHLALHDALDGVERPAAVRCALEAVIRRILSFDNFDENGWLKIGVCGSQPDLGESYINTGSLYLCTTVFLPLGLNASHPFWTDKAEPWTAAQLWAGQNLPADHAID